MGSALRTLSGAEAALWYVKLWEEAGVLPMPRLAYAPLFTRLEGDLEIVARAFAEVVGVRWCASPGVPVALTRRFVGAWCDLPEIRARAAIDELRRIRFVRDAGARAVGQARPALRTIRGMNHVVNMTAPEAVAEAIREQAAAVGGAASRATA